MKRLRHLFAILVFASFVLPAAALPGPTGFTFDKGAMFTVAGYTGASTLSGFPVLVRIAENSPSGFSYDDLQSKATGADIAFVGMDGTGLPFEIDTWNPSGTSLIWVRLPSMRNGTQFVMCWGSDSSGKAVCGTNPWSAYTGVWHMGETGTPSSSSPVTIHDSTANGLDGSTPVGGAASGSVVGGAWLISPDSNHDRSIRVPVGGSAADPAKKAAADALGTDFHASFWMRAKGVVQWANLICRRKGDQGTGWGFSFHENSGSAPKLMRVYAGSTTPATTSGNYNLGATLCATDDVWKKVDIVWKNAANNNVQVADIYLNGAYLETVTCTETVNQQDTDIGIGCSTQDVYNSNDKDKKGRRVNAEMDEVRLGAFVPSADWIAADFATQSSPSFLTAGAAQPYGASSEPQVGVTVSDVSYTNATFVVSVGSLGMDAGMTADASWTDLLLLVGTDSALSSPLLAVPLDRVSAAPSSVSKSLTGLSPNTTYYAQIRATNSLAVAGESIAAPFTTPNPAPVFTASVNMDHLAPDITLSFTGTGWGGAITRITVDVSTSGDFSHPSLSKTYTVDLAAMPANFNDIVLTGLPTESPLYYRFTAENAGGYSRSVEQSASSDLAEGDNVWSGLSEDIDDPAAYVFAGGLPAPGKTLYFTTPAGLSPVIDRDVAMPTLRFTNGKTETVDTTFRDGYHSCGYNLSGSGVLSFTSEKPIVQASYGTNVIRNPILFSRSNSEAVTLLSVGEDKAWLNLNGTLLLPNGVSNTTVKINGRGNTVLGGASPDFMGELRVEGGRLTFASPCAMTNVSKVYFTGDPTSVSNAIGAPLVFPRVSSIRMDNGWPGRKLHEYGAPFVFPQATFEWGIRDYDQSTFDADWVVSNVVVRKHGSNGDACGTKTGAGTFIVKGETSWYDPSVKSYIKLFSGCFWAQTDAGLPPSGEFYLPRDSAWQSTIGLSRDFYPTLDGSSTPRMFQESKWASWGFTGFGGDRTVCWNADPTLNLTNTTSGTVSIPLGDASHVNANGKPYNNYYAYPAYLMFGNRSEFADGTILFLNPIRYELGGQEWDAKTFFESTNHVVAARLRGSLKLGSANKTWTFTGRKFGGYLALEADNSDFTGKVNVTEKGNLLVNSNLVARSVTVQAGSGLGGTGELSTADGTTVKSGGALFGGEWNKGGRLTIGGKVTFENGAALRVEVGASNDRIGCVKLAPGSVLKLGSPVYVDVDTDPRVSPVRGVAIKVLDWSEASFESGSAPTAADFVERPERNSDLKGMHVFVRDQALYVSYVSVRYPTPSMLIFR